MHPAETHDQSNAPEETSFRQASTGSDFFGLELKPFTPARERAAQAMGMKAPAWKPEELELIRTGAGMYAGALKDATIYIWLCSIQTNAEIEAARIEEIKLAKQQSRPVNLSTPGWTVQRADRSPELAYEAACAFGDEQGITLGSPKFITAYEMMVSKSLDILQSRFTVTSDGDSGTDDEEGQKKT